MRSGNGTWTATCRHSSTIAGRSVKRVAASPCASRPLGRAGWLPGIDGVGSLPFEGALSCFLLATGAIHLGSRPHTIRNPAATCRSCWYRLRLAPYPLCQSQPLECRLWCALTYARRGVPQKGVRVVSDATVGGMLTLVRRPEGNVNAQRRNWGWCALTAVNHGLYQINVRSRKYN